MKNRCSRTELEARLCKTSELLAAGMGRKSIHDNLRLLFSEELSDRQLDRYIEATKKRVLEDFSIKNKEQVEVLVSKLAHRLNFIYAEAIKEKQLKTALDVTVSEGKLYGVFNNAVALEHVDDSLSDVSSADLLKLVKNEGEV
jgi:hypothetical protein